MDQTGSSPPPPGSAQDTPAPKTSERTRTSKRARTARRRAARRPFRPTAQERELVKTLAGYGMTGQEIAALIRRPRAKAISVGTLERVFARELEKGPPELNRKVLESLFEDATTPGPQRVTASRLWLQNRAKWKEKINLEIDPETGALL